MLLVLCLVVGCDEAVEQAPVSDVAEATVSADVGADDVVDPSKAPWIFGMPLPATPQETGDPERGRDILLNGNYMSCGIPWSLWSDPVYGPLVGSSFGTGTEVTELEGRTGHNAGLPHTMNAFVAEDGTEVVNRNCLGCHAGRFDGELVIGLPNATVDFTGAGLESAAEVPSSLLDMLPLEPAEREHLDRMFRTARALGSSMRMRTVGQNPAEQMTFALLVHHDPETLAWSETPLYEPVEPRDENGEPIEDAILTSDPPPWWRAHKKNALFYNGMSRGQHRGTMALATAVCVDDLEEARRIDRLFLDMHTFIRTLRAPLYKRPIDDQLAAAGKEIFEDTCAGCHGTYGEDPLDDDSDDYPNLIIPLDVIGTDPAVAEIAVINGEGFELYNASFYGQIAPAIADDPLVGYVAPPLDGVWATAPFLHNGSVPTIELVLDSEARPTYWRRVDYDDTNFDEEALGWPYVEVDTPQAEAPEADRKHIYDTTYYSQSNAGHTFGDDLTDDERRAVIEYLKTL